MSDARHTVVRFLVASAFCGCCGGAVLGSVSCIPTPEVKLGRKFDTSHVSDIRTCVTTEGSLLAWFGPPYRRGNDNGFPTLEWSYAWAKRPVGSPETESGLQSLVVVLNQSGQVVHFTLNPTCATTAVRDTCADAGNASPQ